MAPHGEERPEEVVIRRRACARVSSYFFLSTLPQDPALREFHLERGEKVALRLEQRRVLSFTQTYPPQLARHPPLARAVRL